MHTPDQKPRNRLWTLFTSMLTISSFTFGGGFVIVTLMKRRFVDELGWMDEDRHPHLRHHRYVRGGAGHRDSPVRAAVGAVPVL